MSPAHVIYLSSMPPIKLYTYLQQTNSMLDGAKRVERRLVSSDLSTEVDCRLLHCRSLLPQVRPIPVASNLLDCGRVFQFVLMLVDIASFVTVVATRQNSSYYLQRLDRPPAPLLSSPPLHLILLSLVSQRSSSTLRSRACIVKVEEPIHLSLLLRSRQRKVEDLTKVDDQ